MNIVTAMGIILHSKLLARGKFSPVKMVAMILTGWIAL
jgi:hypothetical protein